MNKLAAAVAVLLWGAPVVSAQGLVTPSDGGVAIGDRVVVEVKGGRQPGRLTLDGAPVTPTWTRVGTRRRWTAEVPLAMAGAHRLEYRRGLLRKRVTFSNAPDRSLPLAQQVAGHFLR